MNPGETTTGWALCQAKFNPNAKDLKTAPAACRLAPARPEDRVCIKKLPVADAGGTPFFPDYDSSQKQSTSHRSSDPTWPLNGKAINILRSFPIRGTVVRGARTPKLGPP